MPKIVIYTRDSCSPCRNVKWFLNKRGFEFEEKNIDEPDNFNEFAKIADTMMVPLIIVGDWRQHGLNLSSLGKVLDFYNK